MGCLKFWCKFYLYFLLFALASSISLFISNLFLVLRECDVFLILAPVFLFGIYDMYFIDYYLSITQNTDKEKYSGCEAWIRTKIHSFRGYGPTIRRPRKIILLNISGWLASLRKHPTLLLPLTVKQSPSRNCRKSKHKD